MLAILGEERMASIKKQKGLHLFKHGFSRSRTTGAKVSGTYNSWRGMKERCTNPNHKNYVLYAGKLDDPRWLNFMNFLEDMGERPSSKHSLDRVDNTKGYSKHNCRWALVHEQHRNHSRNLNVEFYGTHCCKDLALAMEVNYPKFRERINKGWRVENALMSCQTTIKRKRK